MTASSSTDTHSDSDSSSGTKKPPVVASSAVQQASPKNVERNGSFIKKQRLMILADEQDDSLLDDDVVAVNEQQGSEPEGAPDQNSRDEEDDVSGVDEFDMVAAREDDAYDSTEEFMVELEMIGEGPEAVAALSDEEDLLNGDVGNVLAVSSPTSPVITGRRGLGTEPFTVDVSPISPIMMLPPLSSAHRGGNTLMRLSPQPLRMDEPDIFLPSAVRPSPLTSGASNFPRAPADSDHQESTIGFAKTLYTVRMANDKQNDDELTVKARARKRVRDFVIGLQSRHFHPYDPNDFSLGLPESHPMHSAVRIVKVETQGNPPSPMSAASAAMALNPPSSFANGTVVQQSQPKEKKKSSRRGSVSSATSPALKGRSSSIVNHLGSDFLLPVGGELSAPTLATFRHPGSARHGNHKVNATKVETQKAKFEADGSVYEGEMVGGLRHGLGVVGYWNGSVYVGEFRKGQEHGIGELRDASGALIYRGSFEHGKICGYGTFYYADGSVYRGEMREGARHGKGIIWYNDGTSYEGDFVHGMRAGAGTFTARIQPSHSFPSQYNGEWANDVRHGKGTLKLMDGTVLEGQFKDNHPDGRCCVTFASDGSFYEGGFKDGLKEGRGTYKFGGGYGAVYEGRFARDVIGGIGTIKLTPNWPIVLPSDEKDPAKAEWMMPIDLQCEIRAVHLKAGFAIDGT